MYRDNMKLFFEKLMPDNEKMAKFINDGDFSNFSIAVHAMKSMLASVGAQGLSALALKLETASKSGDTGYCIKQFPYFSQRLAALHERLSPVFPPEEIREKKEKRDAAALREDAQKALDAVNKFDNDAGIEILNNVSAYDFGGEINKMLEDAVKELKQYQYDEAKDTLTNLVSRC
jgi:HPt (histidine-containing phosphotransfer) domain-containing protein